MRVDELFEVDYGHSLSLNRLRKADERTGIAFVSRTAQNNGVVAWVEEVEGVEALPPGLITVSLRSRNHPLASFVQIRPFYTAFHLYVLTPRSAAMTINERLFWAMCIEKNRYRYNFGRQANRSLRGLKLPDVVPSWALDATATPMDGGPSGRPVPLPELSTWDSFRIDATFKIHRGRSITRRDAEPGTTPLVSASGRNNGITAHVGAKPDHPPGRITVASNGSVGEAFVQPRAFVATSDVSVLEPPASWDDAAKHFACTVLRAEKYRFNYGRKWPSGRLAASTIRLPAIDGMPDHVQMSAYMRGLPLSRAAFDVI